MTDQHNSQPTTTQAHLEKGYGSDVQLDQDLIPASQMEHKKTASEGQSNAIKDPKDWVTGKEKMTGAQESYLKTLSAEAHVEFDPSLNKAEASGKIQDLQAETGRGAPNSSPSSSEESI